jgi:DNA-binding response OmpR family regulator
MSDEPRRVLFVEDDHDLASAVAGLLVDEGYVVDQFYDGDAALTSCCPSAADFESVKICAPRECKLRC